MYLTPVESPNNKNHKHQQSDTLPPPFLTPDPSKASTKIMSSKYLKKPATYDHYLKLDIFRYLILPSTGSVNIYSSAHEGGENNKLTVACVWGGRQGTGWVDTSNSYDLFISSLSGLTVKIQALIVKIQIKAFSMSLIILFSK